jgi:hypothetical protein
VFFSDLGEGMRKAKKEIVLTLLVDVRAKLLERSPTFSPSAGVTGEAAPTSAPRKLVQGHAGGFHPPTPRCWLEAN